MDAPESDGPDRIWAEPWYHTNPATRQWDDEEWFVALEPNGTAVEWVNIRAHNAELAPLRAIIKADNPREELLWARAHVAELEAAARSSDAELADLRAEVERLRQFADYVETVTATGDGLDSDTTIIMHQHASAILAEVKGETP